MKKRFTEVQIVAILREAESGVRTVVELARQRGASEPTIYGWRRKFGGMGQNQVHRLRELGNRTSDSSGSWPSVMWRST